MSSESSRYVNPEEMAREAIKLTETLARVSGKENAHTRIAKFHAHLDICEQCERHPFDLCPEGAKLLKYAATGQ